jgi:hypothetical protein
MPKTGRYGQISPHITILKTEARSFERFRLEAGKL